MEGIRPKSKSRVVLTQIAAWEVVTSWQHARVVGRQCLVGGIRHHQHAYAAPQYTATLFNHRGRVVVFGPVPDEVATVRLNLVDGSQPTVRTSEHNGVHYFVRSVEAEDKGPTILLDSAGREVTPG